MLRQKKFLLVLLLITLSGAILRFQKLDWGHGYFFHPDEGNIIRAIGNLDLANLQLDPKFWAYGSLPIYLIYLLALLLNTIGQTDFLTFDNLTLIGRTLSAVSATLIIPLTFVLTRKFFHKLHNKNYASLLCSLWVAFLPGLIQFAHFTTFEIYLTLLYLLTLLLSTRVAHSGNTKEYLLTGVLIGLGIGTKITSLVIIPVFILAHLIAVYNQHTKNLRPDQLINKNLLFTTVIIIITTFLSSPFHILNYPGFNNSYIFESSVAKGTLDVFYTQQFQQTIPGLYQISRVFPYILTIPITALSILGLIHLLIVVSYITTRKLANQAPLNGHLPNLLLLLTIIISYLGFHFTLYVKWTRYMIPILPFLAVLSVIYLVYPGSILNRTLKLRLARPVFVLITSGWVIMSGINFAKIYQLQDTRVQASEWAELNIPKDSSFASEVYDLGILPFNDQFSYQNIKLLDLYDIELSPRKQFYLENWENSDYFISLSQRIYKTRYRLNQKYPAAFEIYKIMFEERAGWKQVARFSQENIDCSIWTLHCLGYYFPPDETFIVFDHPTVIIFEHEAT